MERKSNIELLRIISMLLIIIFHCAYKSGFVFEEYFSMNKFLVKIFWMFGELGVNLFGLISGYHMIQGRFKHKKLILLTSEVFFYQIFTHVIACKVGIFQGGGIKDTFLRLFPVTLNYYWFITAYVIIYTLSPYLNVFIYAMEQKVYRKFLITVLILYSVIPTVFGIFFNSTETLLYYNRLIWLMIVYFIGAYVKLYNVSVIAVIKNAVITSVLSFGILIISILFIEKFSTFFAMLGTTEVAYFWPPNTVPMIFFSVGVFGIFLHLDINYNSVINRVASTTLGIYLLHDSAMLSAWLWGDVAKCATYDNSPFLIIRILFVSVIIFLAGMVVDMGRQLLEKYTLQKVLNSRIMGKD